MPTPSALKHLLWYFKHLRRALAISKYQPSLRLRIESFRLDRVMRAAIAVSTVSAMGTVDAVGATSMASAMRAVGAIRAARAVVKLGMVVTVDAVRTCAATTVASAMSTVGNKRGECSENSGCNACNN